MTGRKYSYSIVTDQPIKEIEPSRYHSKAQISTSEGQVTLYSNSITLTKHTISTTGKGL